MKVCNTFQATVMLVASAVTLTPLVRTLVASFNGPGNSAGDESCRGCFFLFGTLLREGVDIRGVGTISEGRLSSGSSSGGSCLLLGGVRMVAQLLRWRKNSGKSTTLKSKNKLCFVIKFVGSMKLHKSNIWLWLNNSIEYQASDQIVNDDNNAS